MANQNLYKMTQNKYGIKCLPIGSNGRPAGIAQEYGTTPSTAFDRQALLEALNNIPGVNNDTTEMRDINRDRWIDVCVDINDDPNKYEIIHIQDEIKHLDNPAGVRWIKVALRIKGTNRIMMASITNYNGQDLLEKKTTKFTRSNKWFLDRRTLLTDRTFWDSLRNKL